MIDWQYDLYFNESIINHSDSVAPFLPYSDWEYFDGSILTYEDWLSVGLEVTPPTVGGGRIKRRKRIDWQAEENDIMAIINTINTFLHIRRH